MKIKITFEFKFKGNRNYIHGTDLFNKSIKFLSAEGFNNISNIDMAFHKIMRSQLSGFFCSEKESSCINNSSFIFSFHSNNKKYYIGLNENEIDIDDRYKYPEEEILLLSSFNLEEKSIKLVNPINYSNIEKFVALNKGLLEKLYPNIDGKWYFSRLQMDEVFDANNFIKIVLKRNMNFKLTKSIIYVDSKKIGFIYFTLI